MQLEKTIPEDIRLSDIREFVINVGTKTIDVHLENGDSYTLDRPTFLNFWNNDMNATQRNIVKAFIKSLSALAADVDGSKITGDFGD